MKKSFIIVAVAAIAMMFASCVGTTETTNDSVADTVLVDSVADTTIVDSTIAE